MNEAKDLIREVFMLALLPLLALGFAGRACSRDSLRERMGSDEPFTSPNEEHRKIQDLLSDLKEGTLGEQLYFSSSRSVLDPSHRDWSPWSLDFSENIRLRFTPGGIFFVFQVLKSQFGSEIGLSDPRTFLKKDPYGVWMISDVGLCSEFLMNVLFFMNMGLAREVFRVNTIRPFRKEPSRNPEERFDPYMKSLVRVYELILEVDRNGLMSLPTWSFSKEFQDQLSRGVTESIRSGESEELRRQKVRDAVEAEIQRMNEFRTDPVTVSPS